MHSLFSEVCPRQIQLCTSVNKQRHRQRGSKMIDEKFAGPSGLVSKMVKTAGEAKVYMIAVLVNGILVGRVIPVE